MKELNLNSYYYSFESTGNKDIDAILYAVAQAGKAFHNTEEWSEEHEWLNDGISAAENIQIAANNAANNLHPKLNK